MHLYDVPLIFAGIGLVLYTVLGGADFGAGFWHLLPGRGAGGRQVREHSHASIAPVWEANHVWLIFVLTVVWTAYPVVFASIASTLWLPFFIAAIGIILRGTAYATRSGSSGPVEVVAIDTVFALSSILTPFALGTMVGAIASRRVPVGNAAGPTFSSWLAPTPILIGVLAVATSAYLAAVYLAADAVRRNEPELAAAFRRRALAAGLCSGLVALVGVAVLRADAHQLYERLLHTDAIAGLVASILAGLATLELVRRRRFDAARLTAALAVAAMVAGWAIAANPTVLPGLTIRAAAAPQATLVSLVVAILAGGLILFPSLGLLFRLVLSGQFDDPGSRVGAEAGWPAPAATRPGGPAVGRVGILGASRAGVFRRAALACLLAGFVLLTLADPQWAHAVGVVALFGFIGFGFVAITPELGAEDDVPAGPIAHRP